MPLWAAIALALCAAGCRCEAPLVQLQPARVVVSPHELVLPVAWVGQQTSGVVELSNQGEATAELEVTVVGASFASSPTTLRLARGQSAEVRVTFAPGSAGAHEGRLLLGELEVAVRAEALDVPECRAGACEEAHFDFAQAQMVYDEARRKLTCFDGVSVWVYSP